MKQTKQTTEAMPIDKGNGHTPGEWIKQDNIVYIKEGSVNIYAFPVIEKDYPVAYALINSKVTTKQAKENAALIASAPQLKAENEKFKEQWDVAIKANDYMVKEDQKHRDLADQLKAENKKKDETIRELLEALEWMIQTVKRDGIIDHITHEGMIEDCENVIAKHSKT